MNKLGRLQYKTSQEQSARLNSLEASISSLAMREKEFDAMSYSVRLAEERLDTMALAAMRWLDDLDALQRQLTDDASTWQPLLSQWIEHILSQLSAVDVQEIPVLGVSFDARFCEALQSVEVDPADQLAPYQVMQVLRRGFMRANGSLLRKAIVITARERSFPDEF